LPEENGEVVGDKTEQGKTDKDVLDNNTKRAQMRCAAGRSSHHEIPSSKPHVQYPGDQADKQFPLTKRRLRSMTLKSGTRDLVPITFSISSFL
jgi:hypothetical protein